MGAGRGRYTTIEGLRALAALSILVYHVCLSSLGSATLLRFAHHLEVGVPVFFTITGFVLYRPWVDGRPNASRYARRRAARIVPAYWIALTAVLVLGLARGDAGGRPLIFYAFLQDYSAQTTFWGLQVAWSLCVEVLFYALLPLLALAAARTARPAVACAAGIVAVLAVRAVAGAAGNFALTYTILGTLDWFLLGMALAVVSVRREDLVRRVDPALAAAAALALFAVAGAAGLPWGAGGEYTPVGWTLQHVAYGAIGLLAVLAAVAAEARARGAVRGVLAARPVVWLGLVSYGIFLWHVPVLIAYQRLVEHGWAPANGVVALAWTLAVTIPVAAASWYLVERPSLRSRFARAPAAAQLAEAVSAPAVT